MCTFDSGVVYDLELGIYDLWVIKQAERTLTLTSSLLSLSLSLSILYCQYVNRKTRELACNADGRVEAAVY